LHAKMSGVTRQLRKSVNDTIVDVEGPVLDTKCSSVCTSCLTSLQKNKVPLNALVNGNWIGDIPPQLQDLTWMEKMLISRVCHNRCVVHVTSSGMHKMSAMLFFSLLQCQKSMHFCHQSMRNLKR
jgi:hypothetical protein